MAKYNINNIENDEKFLQFIKDEYGYESFGDIPPFETTALLIKFRMREKDDFSLNEEVGKTLNPEALKANIKDEEAARIKEIYFGSKDAVLETEDRVFLAAVTHTIKENNQNIESIRIYKEAQKQGIKPNNNTNQNQTGIRRDSKPSIRAMPAMEAMETTEAIMGLRRTQPIWQSETPMTAITTHFK